LTERSLRGLIATAALLLVACNEQLPLVSVPSFKGAPTVKIVSAQITGGTVTVTLATSGKFTVVDAAAATEKHVYGEGHFHLFLDTLTPAGQAIPKGVPGIFHTTQPTFLIPDVTNGDHVLWVVLGYSDHTPYEERTARDSVSFHVGGGAPGVSPAPTQVAQASPSAAPSAAVSPVAGPVAATVQVVSDPNTVGAFKPAGVSVKVGQAVEWDFADQNAPHTATSDDGTTFDSSSKSAGEKYTFTFAKAGKYAYHCTIHPQMTATITVS
jgi:plastocyanin